MDATDIKVEAELVAGAAHAYGYRPSLTDEQSRELRPEEWCNCSHHITEHHGPHGDQACSATDCPCTAFAR